MTLQVFDYDPPERFVVGTVGEPGSRTFFLQARGGGRLTSVSLEKQQVQALAERIDQLLDQVGERTGNPVGPPSGPMDLDPLDNPIEEEFRVATMSLGYDTEHARLQIECYSTDLDPESGFEEPHEGSVLKVRLEDQAARRFAQRAAAVVAAGRPPCPLCGGPLDVQGHICPRANGYRR